MAKHVTRESLKKLSLFRGLTEDELDDVAKLCLIRTYEVGELCQFEGQMADQVHFISRGRLGVEFHIPNIAYGCNPPQADWTLLVSGIYSAGRHCLKARPGLR